MACLSGDPIEGDYLQIGVEDHEALSHKEVVTVQFLQLYLAFHLPFTN